MEGVWRGRLARYRRFIAITAGIGAATALALTAANAGQAQDNGGQAKNTNANYTPVTQFKPLESSTDCPGEESGREAEPFKFPTAYSQQVIAEEGDPGTNQNTDNWDMNTQNEFGKDAGRYVYRTHENRTAPQFSQISVTDLKTGETKVLAERADWEAFDGIVWTPWGTILAGEEVTTAATRDPQVPQAEAGLVYEFFVDKDDPTVLDPSREPITADDGTEDTVQDGIRARPALGSKSHEGMRFDKQGNHYGIHESSPGSIYRFVPDTSGDLSEGTLQALRTLNGHDGRGIWVDIPDEEAETDAQAGATDAGANAYNRPEDVETGQSTGVDKNNNGNTLYVALTGTDEVMVVDLSDESKPFAYDYVGHTADNAPTSSGEFDMPDNLALDRNGNLAITEDPGGTPPTKTKGDDIFIAKPSGGNDGKGGSSRQPAEKVKRFASLKDCIAEPTGIYFALDGTGQYTKGGSLEGQVNAQTLFVDRQHAGQDSPIDQLVAIRPR